MVTHLLGGPLSEPIVGDDDRAAISVGQQVLGGILVGGRQGIAVGIVKSAGRGGCGVVVGSVQKIEGQVLRRHTGRWGGQSRRAV